jgi:hypothetical protein
MRGKGVLVMDCGGECDVWERNFPTFGDGRGFAGIIVRWRHATSITVSHDTRQIQNHVQSQLISKGYIHLLASVQQFIKKDAELKNNGIASVL